MQRQTKYNNRSHRAFTLVELIIVLVVLALLAAMLVPALTGYIKQAKKGRYYDQAHYALTAAQSVMSEIYAKDIKPSESKPKNDVIWTAADNTWGNKVLSLIDCGRGSANREPYILIFGTGDYKTYGNTTDKEHLPYTVFFIGYVADENAPAIYYVDGTWTYKYPWEDGTMLGGGNDGQKLGVGSNKGTKIELYVVSNRTGSNIDSAAFWTGTTKSLRSHSEPYFKG